LSSLTFFENAIPAIEENLPGRSMNWPHPINDTIFIFLKLRFLTLEFGEKTLVKRLYTLFRFDTFSNSDLFK